MEVIIIASLMIIGLLLVLIEIFFLPGVTIAGISALFFFGSAVYYAFSQIGYQAGILIAILSVIVCIGGVLAFMKSKMVKNISLKTTIDSVSPTKIPSSIKVGDKGVTVSRLNPMGHVVINNVKIEARAEEYFLDENTEVEVDKVESTTVVVKKIKRKE